MLSFWRILGLTALAVLVCGCGCGKSNDGDQGQTPGMSVNGPSEQDRSAHAAKMVVSDFLNALRRGDDSKAKSLLTKLAREKADEKGKAIAPPADDAIKIEIDDATFPTPEHDIAHVPTRWFDQDENGKPRTDRSIWVCRIEPEGWRVAGFADYAFEGEDPVFMNFEDPDDMAKHQEMMNEEFERRSKLQSAPRSSGETPMQAAGVPKDAFRR
jgi:hypothetical protein